MISHYPLYNKDQIYINDEKEIDDILEFITLFRNKKKELNIPSTYKVKIDIKSKELKELVINILKLKDKELPFTNNEFIEKIEKNNYKIEIEFDNSKNKEEEHSNLEHEKEKLLNSIERRKKLLSNQNYVSKAPANIVENERLALEKEEQALDLILEKLK